MNFQRKLYLGEKKNLLIQQLESDTKVISFFKKQKKNLQY